MSPFSRQGATASTPLTSMLPMGPADLTNVGMRRLIDRVIVLTIAIHTDEFQVCEFTMSGSTHISAAYQHCMPYIILHRMRGEISYLPDEVMVGDLP